MQIVSIRDSLHEMSKPIFLEDLEKYFKMPSAEYFTQSDKIRGKLYNKTFIQDFCYI